MTTRTAGILDVADYLGASPAMLSRAVLQALHGRPGGEAADFYAGRITSLGLSLPAAVMALASVIPGTRVTGQVAMAPADDRAAAVSAVARQALLDASDPSLHRAIDRIVRASAEPADPISIGQLRCEVDRRVAVAAYLNPRPTQDWRYGVMAAMEDIVCVVAARTLEAGLVFGPNVVFHGQSLDGASERLQPGWVMFGPRANLPQGRYRLDMDIGLDPTAALSFDIVSQRGLRKLAELDLRGSTKINLGFTVGHDDPEVEVRLVNLGTEPVTASIRTLLIRRG